MMLHRSAPGFAESQEGQAVLPLPTFSSLRSKGLVSLRLTCSPGKQRSARWTVALPTPTLPRGSGLSDSGSVCAESASSHSVAGNASNIVNFTLVESSRIDSFSDFSWIPMHAVSDLYLDTGSRLWFRNCFFYRSYLPKTKCKMDNTEH